MNTVPTGEITFNILMIAQVNIYLKKFYLQTTQHFKMSNCQ